jgi:peptide-methionine (S)-S-oxide reductase
VPRAQRGILITAVALATIYGWLRGGFAFVSADGPPEGGHHALLGDGPTEAGRHGVQHENVATFAAGCFWSAEVAFEGLPGVSSVTAGYTGGTVANPTYAQVTAGATGHAEAVEIRFDPARVTYADLLDRFWHEIDLFAAHQQFCDLGDQYRPAVFVHDAAQREAAESSRHHWQEHFGRRIAVAIEDAGPFYRAEAHHQDFATRNPAQYRYYRWSCGRDVRLREIWQTAREVDPNVRSDDKVALTTRR